MVIERWLEWHSMSKFEKNIENRLFECWVDLPFLCLDREREFGKGTQKGVVGVRVRNAWTVNVIPGQLKDVGWETS